MGKPWCRGSSRRVKGRYHRGLLRSCGTSRPTCIERCASFGALLVVNDHWKIALEEGAPYIHLGQDDLKTADATRIHQAGVKLGISTHDHMELGKARAIRPAYIALGPIWGTTLKVMPWRPQGINHVKLWSMFAEPHSSRGNWWHYSITSSGLSYGGSCSGVRC